MSDLLKKKEYYIETLQELNGVVKLNTMIFGAPLVLIATQFRFLLNLESIWIKASLSIAVVCFLYGSYFNFLGGQILKWIIIREKLHLYGSPSKGEKYLARYETVYGNKGFPLTEQGGINYLDKYENRLQLAMLIGWGFLVLSFFIAIWT